MGIALLATFFSCIVGSVLGAIAGYFGNAVDNIIMRALDIFMSVMAMAYLPAGLD